MMAIEDQIKDYMAENILFSDDGFQYEHDVSFIQEGILDSVGVLELVAFVKDRFGVNVYDQEVTLENFDSVDKLANYIRRKLGVTNNQVANEKMPYTRSLSA